MEQLVKYLVKYQILSSLIFILLFTALHIFKPDVLFKNISRQDYPVYLCGYIFIILVIFFIITLLVGNLLKNKTRENYANHLASGIISIWYLIATTLFIATFIIIPEIVAGAIIFTLIILTIVFHLNDNLAILLKNLVIIILTTTICVIIY